MAELGLNVSLRLATRRCGECGTYWAIERGRQLCGERCPRCAGAEIEKARERVMAAEKSVVAFKAAATRARRK